MRIKTPAETVAGYLADEVARYLDGIGAGCLVGLHIGILSGTVNRDAWWSSASGYLMELHVGMLRGPREAKELPC